MLGTSYFHTNIHIGLAHHAASKETRLVPVSIQCYGHSFPPFKTKHFTNCSAYPTQASLVTTADRSSITRRDNEPTGEAESLVGRINPKEMGSRAFKEDLDPEAKRKKAEKERLRREKKEESALGAHKAKKVAGDIKYGNVLEATEDR